MKKTMFNFLIILFFFFTIILSCDRYGFLPWEDAAEDKDSESGGGGAVNNAVYVSTAGIAGNTGLTPLDPVNDIQAAISIAAAEGRNRVNITGETYNLGYINLASGISLYGGYSNDFSVRDISGDRTIINYLNNAYGIYAYSINNVTIDGFVINPIGVKSAGFNCSLSDNITISNNIFNSSGSNMVKENIYITASGNVSILNNYITSYTYDSEGYCIHIISPGSSTLTNNTRIINNIIITGPASAAFYGIVATIYKNSAVDILNNTIDNRYGAVRYGVFFENLDGLTASLVSNNLFISNEITQSYGLHKPYSNDNVSLQDNNNAYITLQHYNLLSGTLITILNNINLSGLNDYLCIIDYNANNYNLFDHPTMSASLDLIYSAPSGSNYANEIIYGGLQGNAPVNGWGFNWDYDYGAARTGNGILGWSMGAYERD